MSTMPTHTERRAPSEDGDVRLYGAHRLRRLAEDAQSDTEQALLVHAAYLLDGGVVEVDDA